MKASDYIAQFISEQGVRDAFVLTGGCIVHAIDSIAQNPKLRYVPVQHEQAGAMAADAYSRITENLGVVLTTSGPGATNLLTGTCCSYYDSIPVLNITGQVPANQLKRDSGSRQIGFQETDVVGMFRPATKYAVLVDDARNLRYELEKATHIARSGRPGPVLVDICDDVQRADINPNSLRSYTPENTSNSSSLDERLLGQTMDLMRNAKRPVVIMGAGVRLSGTSRAAAEFLEKSGLPYTLTWGAMDCLPQDSPNYVGGFGVTSPRPGNFAVQNADLVVALGTRLDTHEVGSWKTFARDAKKVVLDLDESEMEKYERLGMKVDVPIVGDVRSFFRQMNPRLDDFNGQDLREWNVRTQEWLKRYPVVTAEHWAQIERVNPYVFMEVLSNASKPGDVIVTDCGSNLIWTMQAWKTKRDQRLISAWNHSPMGYALPASMGAALATGKPVTCITGDGGMQMNIQELATLKRHNIPTRVFVLNNHGHGIIQGTLEAWLQGRNHAAHPAFGLPDPDYVAIAEAYGLPTMRIRDHTELGKGIDAMLHHSGPIVCEVDMLCRSQIAPKLLSGRPIEDPSPLLPRDEFRAQMIVDPLSISLQ